VNDSARGNALQAREAVASAFGTTNWTVTSLGGSTATAWRATGERTVVVRLDADVEVLRRVAEIGIAPAVISAGDVGGRRYVIQEHVDMPSPSVRWLREHAEAAAALFATLARDRVLRTLGVPLDAGPWADSLLSSARAATLDRIRLDRVERLAAEAPLARSDDLTASHGDPNRSNFLAGDRLALLDWDEFRLADRMRDVGQFAWWYLPETQWPSFLIASGTGSTNAIARRLYWWAAAESLDVALRLLSLDPSAAERFLVDFDHAAEGRPNPRREH
jgi:hypothetical protein